MALTTYRILAEKILTTFYSGVRSDDAQFSLRHVSQLISEEMSGLARQNAFENSNLGETTYSSDTFITTFKNITILTDSALKTKYIPLPSLPTALPSNQEIQKVWPVIPSDFDTPTNVQIVPMSNRSSFSQGLLPTIRGFLLYYIEGVNLVFSDPKKVRFTAVNINMIGAMPNGELLDAPLTLPKSYESILSTKVIQRLLQTSKLGRDVLNDSEPINTVS